jgi:hypothetical protein
MQMYQLLHSHLSREEQTNESFLAAAAASRKKVSLSFLFYIMENVRYDDEGDSAAAADEFEDDVSIFADTCTAHH